MGVVNEMVQARNQNLLGAGGWGEANPKVGGQSTPPPRNLLRARQVIVRKYVCNFTSEYNFFFFFKEEGEV